jgi:hypothetical protein
MKASQNFASANDDNDEEGEPTIATVLVARTRRAGVVSACRQLSFGSNRRALDSHDERRAGDVGNEGAHGEHGRRRRGCKRLE